MAEIKVRFSQTIQSVGARVTEGGLSEIFHDETLEGKGTSANPLGVAESVLQDIDSRVEKTAEAEKVYGTDENGDQTTYDLDSFGKVDDVQVNGESVVENKVADITIGNATITLQKNGMDVDSFTTNATQNKSINITVPTQASDVGALPDTTTINDLTTEAQQNALNSGITSAGVSQITTNKNDIATINGKIPATASSSNKLTDKSYVDGEISSVENDIATINGKIPSAASSSNQLTDKAYVDGEITTVEGDIADINAKIPEQASASNKLADKNFVNSSISTNTANFIGTFNSVEELEAYSGTVTNNDYAFVISEDLVGNTVYNRYKYTTATTPASWQFEYALNNSSFTADQWAAINSGATTTNIGQIATNTTTISGHIANKNNPHEVTKAQVGLGNVNNTSDADKPVSTATQTALDAKADKTNRINGAPLSNTTSSFYGTSDTAAATAQKEVSIPSITNLDVGTIIIVQPTATSTVANSTIKLNNFDAYPMRYNNAAITTTTDSIVWNSSYPSTFLFDGTYWVFAGHGVDSDTTYTLNYSLDQGFYRAGSGTYAITRYSLILQKPNGTWEKTTSTSSTYSTDTNKTVNTNGFILNQIRYYGATNTVANGGRAATNTVYQKSSQVDMRYSTNCGETTTWTVDEYVYLVGSMGADGLFYLDTTQWWTNALPTTNDGKLYIRLGLVLSNSGYVISFFDDRPIFYHDGTVIKEYKVADNKQDVISDLATIRSGAAAGSTAVQPGDLTTKANTDLDNLTDVGKNLANWSHNVSNCIIEIPQDINLTLSNGTLTLKSGSKITASDGSQRTTTADKTTTLSTDGQYFAFVAATDGSFQTSSNYRVNKTASGTSLPSDGSTYLVYFKTDESKIYRWNGSAWVAWAVALPICIYTVSGGAITSIDQVFNGFGYIGNDMFVLPGVKCLVPNGRNTDGTLNNTLYTASTVRTSHQNSSGTYQIRLGSSFAGNKMVYNEEDNYNYLTSISPANKRNDAILGVVNCAAGGVITSIEPKTPFHAVDYSEYQKIVEQVETNTTNIALKQDEATALNYDNISNCITEIPQDINLTLSSGTLTLKAGSKVYVPNGNGVFTELSVTVDRTSTGTANQTRMYFYNGSYIEKFPVSACYSGTTAPSGKTYMFWYDTTNNVVKKTSDGGSTWESGWSLPFAICTSISNVISSIDQVFNGFGYIGSTVFALPGVKGLIPNGRNSDGTLKNIIINNSSVRTNTASARIDGDYDWYFRNSNTQDIVSPNTRAYDSNKNIIYSTGSGDVLSDRFLACKIKWESNKVVLLASKTPFHAVDYSDFVDLQTTVSDKADSATTADTSLSNLTSTGANISNWSTNVSNCLVEIPQDITLTLSSGTLSVKSGSKVYFPNGANTFTAYTFTADKTVSMATNGKYLVGVGNNSKNIALRAFASTTSGATDSMSGQGYHWWYDTTNNVINSYGSDASTPNDTISLPIAIITVSGGAISSIDQVFNGFGYIGSTAFALPNIKGLAPDGRNSDGSLKSNLVSLSTVKTYSFSSQTADISLVMSTTPAIGSGLFSVQETIASSGRTYIPSQNRVYQANSTEQSCFLFADVSISSGKITSLTPRPVFHAVDYNDVSNQITTMLDKLYPVGSVYFGTQATCPMETLLPNSTWELVSSGKAIWTGDGTNGNTTIEAGVPNITGTMSACVELAYGGAGEDDTGAFEREEISTYAFSAQNLQSHYYRHKLDASRSSSVYGNSTTVQPPAYVVNVWRRTA